MLLKVQKLKADSPQFSLAPLACSLNGRAVLDWALSALLFSLPKIAPVHLPVWFLVKSGARNLSIDGAELPIAS